MPIIVNYEVYVMTSDGTWSLIEQFEKSGEMRAFSVAKKIEAEQKYPTKVVLSAFNNVTKRNKETILYMSDGVKDFFKQKDKNRYRSGLYDPTAVKMKSSLANSLERKATSGNVLRALSKLGLVVLLALAIAFVLAAISVIIVSRFGTDVDSYVASRISLTVFLTAFTLSVLPLLAYFVPWQDFNNSFLLSNKNEDDEKPYFVEDEEFYVPQESFSQIKSFFDWFFHNDAETISKYKAISLSGSTGRFQIEPTIKTSVKKVFDKNPLLSENHASVTPPSENINAFDPNSFADKKSIDENNEDAFNDKSKFNPDHFKDIANITDIAGIASAPINKEKEKVAEKSPITMQEIKEIGDFANSVIGKIKKQHPKINNHGKMGLHLMIAGACEKLCENMNIPMDKVEELVIKSIELLGANRYLAQSFAENFEGYHYSKDYRYMIDIGSDAYERDKKGLNDAFSRVPEAFSEWTEIERKELMQKTNAQNSDSIITILFTDIVGSTKATQALGDSVAQTMIREHNRVVRNALKNHFGREVKHTGDGIMASFMSAYKAIAAAIDIQKEVLDYNLKSETGTFPMMLRIGINSGEPIVEDGDFFGATVQVAARICAEAKANQILVSSVVKELSEGKKFIFNDMGLVELRGIEEKKRIYEVVWNIPKKQK